jgi:hypothetical protein
VNAGNQPTSVASLAQVGNVWSVPPVQIRSQAQVNGFVKTSGTLQADAGSTITNLPATQQNTPLDLSGITSLLNFAVQFPATNQGNLIVNAGTSSSLPAGGAWGDVTVNSQGTLLLASGIYFFHSLTVNSQAQIQADIAAGPITVFIQASVIFNGAVATSANRPADLRLVVMGTQAMFNAPFSGVVIAPGAPILLFGNGTNTGAFFGQSIVTQANATCVLAPWDGTLPSPPVQFNARAATVPAVATAAVLSASATRAKAATKTATATKATTKAAKAKAAPEAALVAAAAAPPLAQLVTVDNGTTTITVQLPMAVDIADVLLFSDGGPLVVGGSVLRGQARPPTIVNLSGGGTTIGPDATVGEVWGDGTVTVAARSHVEGFIRSAGTITIDPTASTDLPPQPSSPFLVGLALTVTVTFPATNQGDRTASGATPLTLPPGAYGQVTVAAGGTLILGAGTYFFETLTVASGGDLRLDAAGPIQLNIRTGLTFQGRQRFSWGGPSDLTVVYLGTANLTLGASLAGRILAPNAQLTLGTAGAQATFTGQFFAQSLAVASGNTVSALISGALPTVARYVYGFTGPVGAGTYERLPAVPVDPATLPAPPASRILTLPATSPLTISDNRTYRLTLDASTPISNMTIQSLDQLRPFLLLQSGGGDAANLTAVGGAGGPGNFTLDGIWAASFTGSGDFVIQGAQAPTTADVDWDQVVISSSTLDPGGVRADGVVLQPLRLRVTGRIRHLIVRQSIVASIVVDPTGNVDLIEIDDSIVDAQQTVPDAAGRRRAIVSLIGEVRMARTTVLGDVHADVLTATDCLVMGMVIAADVQHSCFRFSAASLAAVAPPLEPTPRLPELFHVAPIDEIQRFFFTSLRFGDPGYAQLSALAPAELRTGAEKGSEMGAFSSQNLPIRLAGIIAKFDEFRPVAVVPQFVLEGESIDVVAEASE